MLKDLPSFPVVSNGIMYNNSKNVSQFNKINFDNYLERIPLKDSISFKGNNSEVNESISYLEIKTIKNMTEYSRPSDFKGNYTMDSVGSQHPLDNFHVQIDNKLLGRKITGEVFTKDVDLKLESNVNDLFSGRIYGTIDGQKINVNYKETRDRKGFEISGNIPNIDVIPPEDFTSILAVFAFDHMKQCTQQNLM